MIDKLLDALGAIGGAPSPSHCAICGWGFGPSYHRGADGVMRATPYDPTRPCHGCGRTGAVCRYPGRHDCDCEAAE